MYKCECGKEFSSIGGLRAHRYRCEIGKQYYLEEKTYITPNANGEYECECGRTFDTKHGLTLHVIHCKNCSLDFSNKILKHLNRDSFIEDEFECEVCHKKFNTIAGLSLHSTKSGHLMSDKQKSKRLHNKTNDGEFICKICGLRFKTILGLHIHLKKHDIKTIDDYVNYYVTYENFEIPKCKICGKNAKFAGVSNGKLTYRDTCGDKSCISEYSKQALKNVYIDHPEKREERRLSRINYLKNKENFVNTAWGKRANHELSYIEKWFYDNVIIKYNLCEKHNIINEYSFHGYSFDYAFTDLLLDVELDGKIHFIDGQRIKHDDIRDEFVKSHGWHVFRITYDDILDYPNETTDSFLNYIKALKL